MTDLAIAHGLRGLDLPAGAVVLLHSSLSSLGQVADGESAVVRAFLEVLGARGTLVVPTFPFRGYQYDYLSDDPLFDPLTTPSLMGRITEAVRTWPGALRSRHPSHSVAALGPDAAFVTADQERDPWLTFGPESPFGRLAALDGWICLLGVTHRASTFLHAVEEQNGLDYFALPEPAAGRVLTGGRERRIHTSVGRPAVGREFDNVEPLLLAHEALAIGRVGASPVRLMRARTVMAIVGAALVERPHLLLRAPWPGVVARPDA